MRLPGSLEKLLDLAAKDEAAGLGRRALATALPQDGRRSVSRRAVARQVRCKESGCKKLDELEKMPFIMVANSPTRDAALAGLERWKSKYPEAAELLAVDDVLVDSMRGRSSTWTRIRVNLRHVPEALRPPQETPDPDDDPTREWRERMARKKKDVAATDSQRLREKISIEFLRRNHFELRVSAIARPLVRAAICGNAPCAESGFLACARTPLRPPVPAAMVPTINPCPGSSGSARPACVPGLTVWIFAPPSSPWMIRRAHSRGMASRNSASSAASPR